MRKKGRNTEKTLPVRPDYSLQNHTGKPPLIKSKSLTLRKGQHNGENNLYGTDV